jgi:hypothetical protein
MLPPMAVNAQMRLAPVFAVAAHGEAQETMREVPSVRGTILASSIPPLDLG